MTSRELEILHSIYRRGGRSPLRTMSKEMGLSPDYVFLISKRLLNQKLIKKTANNVFILTTSGRSLARRSRNDSEEKEPLTLIEVARSFGSNVELPAFEPEIRFMSRDFISAGLQPTEHNLNKSQIIEMADAKTIQKSIEQLTVVNRARSNY